MAKSKKTPAPAPDPAAGQEPQSVGESTPPDGAGAGSDELQQVLDAGPKVKALVLSDGIYGKCGEVKEFPADKARAIAEAGYIDDHPNAVAAAGG